MGAAEADPTIDRLARLFRDHPAWIRAAEGLHPTATSTVYFAHRPGEAWHLVRTARGVELLPGMAEDPDLVFRFSAESVQHLERVDGGVGEFAVALFSSILEGESDLRIAAGFPRLIRRGYLGLLRRAGPPVLAFGARHGIRNVGALRALVADLRDREPAEWEGVSRRPQP